MEKHKTLFEQYFFMLKPKGQRKGPWQPKTRAFIEWGAKNTNVSVGQIARIASKIKRKETGDAVPVSAMHIRQQAVEKGWRSREQTEWSQKRKWLPPRTLEFIKKALERKKLTIMEIARNASRLYFWETGTKRNISHANVRNINIGLGIRDSETVRKIANVARRSPVIKEHTSEEKKRLLNKNQKLISWAVISSQEKLAQTLRGVAIKLNLPLRDLVEMAKFVFLERIDYWNPKRGTLSTYMAQEIPGRLLRQLDVKMKQPKLREPRLGIDNEEMAEERDSNFGIEQDFGMERIALEQALKRRLFTETEKRTILMLLNGKNQVEIAKLEGVTRSAISFRMRRIREKLGWIQ